MNIFWTFLCDFRFKITLFKLLSSILLITLQFYEKIHLPIFLNYPNSPSRSLEDMWLHRSVRQLDDIAMIFRNLGHDEVLFNRTDSFDITLEISIIFTLYWLLFQCACNLIHLNFYWQQARATMCQKLTKLSFPVCFWCYWSNQLYWDL